MKTLFECMIVATHKYAEIIAEPLIITDETVSNYILLYGAGAPTEEIIGDIIEDCIDELEQQGYSVAIIKDAEVDTLLRAAEDYKKKSWENS